MCHVTVAVNRGVAELTLQMPTGASLQWNDAAQVDLTHTLTTVGADPDVRVIIVTGSGEVCIGANVIADALSDLSDEKRRHSTESWMRVLTNDAALMHAWFGVEVPIIGAVHGPVRVHPELFALCDVLLATTEASFTDGHVVHGYTPGDGAQVVWPRLLGSARAKRFLLLGETLDARQAQEAGMVAELFPTPAAMLEEARRIARDLTRHSRTMLTATHGVLNEELRRAYSDLTPHGLAMQGLAAAAGLAHGVPHRHLSLEDDR